MSIAESTFRTPGRIASWFGRRPERTWNWCLRHRNNRLVQQIPNGLTAVRLAAPPAIYMSYASYRDGHLLAATVWLIITGLLTSTDILDGISARSLQAVSRFGKLADPVMDKAVGITSLLLFVQLVYSSPGHQTPDLLAVWAGLTVTAMIATEIALVALATTGAIKLKSLERQGIDVVALESKLGANAYGKKKFAFQAASVAIGFSLLYWSGPVRLWLAPLVFTTLLSVALVFGTRSLARHLRDVREIRIRL